MIQPLQTPTLSAAKNRCGLQKISDIIPRLIRQYEIQAEIAQAREAEATMKAAAMKAAAMRDAAMIREAKQSLFNDEDDAWLNEPVKLPAIATASSATTATTQQAFNWFE